MNLSARCQGRLQPGMVILKVEADLESGQEDDAAAMLVAVPLSGSVVMPLFGSGLSARERAHSSQPVVAVSDCPDSSHDRSLPGYDYDTTASGKSLALAGVQPLLEARCYQSSACTGYCSVMDQLAGLTQSLTQDPVAHLLAVVVAVL